MSFGDIDAFRSRRYMYTYKTVSNNVKLYQIDANDFVMYLRSNGKDNQFNKWQRGEDQSLINKLAVSLFNKYIGTNIDGDFDKIHTKSHYMINKERIMQKNNFTIPEKDIVVPVKKEEDHIDKVLNNNPGNKERQQAVSVDLSDLEQLRQELLANHFK